MDMSTRNVHEVGENAGCELPTAYLAKKYIFNFVFGVSELMLVDI